MKLSNIMFKYLNKGEPIFEPILRELRYGIAKDFLLSLSTKNLTILDYGCGPEAKFYQYLLDNNISFKKYVGFDPISKKDTVHKNYLQTPNYKSILNEKYDLITMFAVIEHLPFPNFNYSFLSKISNSNSYLIITTPSKASKPILEFLSYKLGLVSKREIGEHQHYYNFNEIETTFAPWHFKTVHKRLFEFGLNNYVILRKCQ